MKKFLVAAVLVLTALGIQAQSLPKNNLSIHVGNNLYFLCPDFTSGSSYKPKAGYQLGMQYSRRLNTHLALLAGFRYNAWNAALHTGELIFGFDAMGNPISSPGVVLEITDRTLQYFTGVRYLGKPGTLRWLVELQAGITDLIEEPAGKTPLRLSAQFASGVEWTHGGISLFATPAVSYVFKELNRESPVGFSFLILSIDLGARWHF